MGQLGFPSPWPSVLLTPKGLCFPGKGAQDLLGEKAWKRTGKEAGLDPESSDRDAGLAESPEQTLPGRGSRAGLKCPGFVPQATLSSGSLVSLCRDFTLQSSPSPCHFCFTSTETLEPPWVLSSRYSEVPCVTFLGLFSKCRRGQQHTSHLHVFQEGGGTQGYRHEGESGSARGVTRQGPPTAWGFRPLGWVAVSGQCISSWLG